MTNGYVILDFQRPFTDYIFLIYFLALVSFISLFLSFIFTTRYCRASLTRVSKSECVDCPKFVEELNDCWWNT